MDIIKSGKNGPVINAIGKNSINGKSKLNSFT